MTHASRASLTALAIVWPALGFAAGPVPDATGPAAAAAPSGAMAAPAEKTTAAPVTPVVPAALATDEVAKPTFQLNETQQYCQNIAAAAADARFAWQRKRLTELEAKLKQRIADLEEREQTFKDFMARRDEMMKRATDTVVGIYSHMKPDSAAKQISALDDELAAAILTQLTQKQASAVLDQIDADRAAKLINVMTAVMPSEKKS
jgi:flagellar motility protein MotE (MotC chaperone)